MANNFLGLGDDQHDLGPDFVIDPWLADFWRVALEMMPLPEGLQPISPFITPPPKYAGMFFNIYFSIVHILNI